MANLKSSKKRARQEVKRRQINLARRTSVKTAVKKVMDALDKNLDHDAVNALLKDAEIKLARAKGKGILHANTVARKISRLSKRVSAAFKQA